MCVLRVSVVVYMGNHMKKLQTKENSGRSGGGGCTQKCSEVVGQDSVKRGHRMPVLLKDYRHTPAR